MAETSVVDSLMIVCGAAVTLLVAVAVVYWIRQERRERARQDAPPAHPLSDTNDQPQPASGNPLDCDLKTTMLPEDRPREPTDRPP